MTCKPHFSRNALACMVAAALLPAATGVHALDLAQSPPGNRAPYVAPNVILSLDDSGSMNGGMNRGGGGAGNRMSILKEALKVTFNDKELLPDGKIRLAWQTMAGCHLQRGLPRRKRNPAIGRLQPNSIKTNAMRVLDATHRKNFLDEVELFEACGMTPTHQMVKHADEYLRNSTLNVNSPWASDPGKTGAPFLGCRKNYHILLTDGGWNDEIVNTPSAVNLDGSVTILPDNTKYNPRYPFQDHEANLSTIADWTFRSWAVKMTPPGGTLTGNPKPGADYLSAPVTETFKNRHNGKEATLEKYWNPRYDPATWPHMNTYTIGFSKDSIPKWAHNPNKTHGGDLEIDYPPTERLPYGYDGAFAEYARGDFVWLAVSEDRGHDMWHAAINGRGQFHAVEQADELKIAFKKIVEHISTSVGNARSGIGASGSSRESSAVGVFESYFDAEKSWKGRVTGKLLQPNGSYESIPGWGGKDTAEILDEVYPANANGRVVISSNAAGNQGVPFLQGNLDKSQWELLGADEESAGKAINYLRGDRAGEGKEFRARDSIHGDVVNSNIWYVKRAVSNYAFADYATPNKYLDFAEKHIDRTAMIYVGGNDGMLHGFEADTGKEKLAYVPKGVMPNLAQLTQNGYEHRYFVDGASMTGDIFEKDSQQWKTVLVGALGAGGKGYYVLDVTNPDSFSQANAKDIVLLDRTSNEAGVAGEAADIGHIFAAPTMDATSALRTVQIARLNDGRWAAIMGNGLNSDSRKSVLLIQYLDGNRELKRIVASNALDTELGADLDGGLGGVTPVDINGDGRPDVVYAGDNHGRMWKFDISSAQAGRWHVAFNGEPLYAIAPVKDAEGNKVYLPISAAPTTHPAPVQVADPDDATKSIEVGGMMVAFGSGRNVTQGDRSDTTTHSLYSVQDNTRYALADHSNAALGQVVRACTSQGIEGCAGTPIPIPVASGKLAQHSFVSTNPGNGGVPYWRMKDVHVNWKTQKGWQVVLPATGERLLSQMMPYQNSAILNIFTTVPANGGNATSEVESCEGGGPVTAGQTFQSMLHIASGLAPRQALFDHNGDGIYDQESEGWLARRAVEDVPGVTPPPTITNPDGTVSAISSTEIDPDKDATAELHNIPVRPNWRQVQ